MKTAFSILIGISYFICIASGQHSQLMDIDYQKLVSQADLIYNKPVKKSEAGQPIGNGRMGSLIWTTPQALRFQINRVDIFGNNSDSDNFYQRHTDYCGGAGFLDIDFQSNEDLFTDKTFKQHLSCFDGTISTEGNKVKTNTFVWSDLDVMAIRVEDSRDIQTPIAVNLCALRDPVTRRGDHSAISKVQIIEDKILLTQEFREDNFFCKSVLIVSLPDNDFRAWIASDSKVKLSSVTGKRVFTIMVSSAATFDPDADVVAMAINQLNAAESKGYEEILDSTKKWWHSYWKKAFVQLHSEDGIADYIEKNYTYYLYLMGSTSRGDYPVKFNGMLWTTGGDKRQWGGFYWGANQSCLYNALFAANRTGLMDPMFNMYSKMIPSCEIAARQQWGSKGIFIPETVGFDGMPELPETIANEMRELYLLRIPWETRSKGFMDYASKKVPHNSRWNWKSDDEWKDGMWYFSDKGGGPFGHVNHLFSRGAKIAYLYWMKYEYNQDREWLAKSAYPIIKGVAEFYRNFPNIKKAEDGKYHIYHINDNESVWGGHNTAEEISAMMGIFPVVIKASEILGIDKEMRPLWSEFLRNLSPLPLSSDHNELTDHPETFVRSLEPALKGPVMGLPDGNTMPQWCFDLITLESGNKKMLTIANTTFDAYFSEGINEESRVHILSKLLAAGTLLGRKEATKFLIPNQIKLVGTEVMENRMHLAEGPQTTTAQRLGRAADALHLALCQSVPIRPGEPSVIRVFPAWPDDWDARFKLLSRGNFLVTSSFQNGQIEFVEISSQSGQICKIHNPWGNEEIDIYRNGGKIKTTNNDLISFKTNINENFVLVRKNKLLDDFEYE